MTPCATTRRNMAVVKTLTYLMFAMFAMTTDSVGLIIPEVIRTFGLSLTAAGTFQYTTMAGIAVGGSAPRTARRSSRPHGPRSSPASSLFAVGLLPVGRRQTGSPFFAVLLGLSGIAIGVFKTGALALIGDISTSTAQHTSIMNMAEGFFGVGAIIGPAILDAPAGSAGCRGSGSTSLPASICVVPDRAGAAREISGIADASADGQPRTGTGRRDAESVRAGLLGRRFPVRRRRGRHLRVDADIVRGLLRQRDDAGRLQHLDLLPAARRRPLSRRVAAGRVQWQAALALFSGGILVCFAISVVGGLDWAVYLLPLSGLFMSVIYPTLNSKGISCLPKSEHGAGAGVILFFTCVSAVLAPLAIGAVGDAFGHIIYGFWLATGFAVLLFVGALVNWLLNPTKDVLEQLDATEYRDQSSVRDQPPPGVGDGGVHREPVLSGRGDEGGSCQNTH